MRWGFTWLLAASFSYLIYFISFIVFHLSKAQWGRLDPSENWLGRSASANRSDSVLPPETETILGPLAANRDFCSLYPPAFHRCPMTPISLEICFLVRTCPRISYLISSLSRYCFLSWSWYSFYFQLSIPYSVTLQASIMWSTPYFTDIQMASIQPIYLH
jgi:hypothetical protein